MENDLFTYCPIENMIMLAGSDPQNSHAFIIWSKLGFDQSINYAEPYGIFAWAWRVC